MNPAYRDILKHSAVYGVGQILTRLASFLLLPLYTSYLRPADYGCIAILDLTAGLLGILIGSGMASAVGRYHFEGKTEHERDEVWWTGLTLAIFLATVIVVPAWLCRDTLARFTLGPNQMDGGYFCGLTLLTLWFSAVTQLPSRYVRVRKWSGLSVAISVTALLLNIGLNVYFLVVLRLGIAGILWGNLLTAGTSTVLWTTFFVRSRGSYAFNRGLAAKLWRFGSPLIATALLGMVMHQADRYLLRVFLHLDQVGIYSLAYTIGQAVNTLCLLPFSAIWGVVVYEIAERADAKQVYTMVFKYFVYFLALILFGVSLFAETILSVMAAPDYAGAAELVPIICLAYFFFSLEIHFNVPALLAKKTVRLLPAYFIAAGANIGINVLLIPLYGTSGAAWASVLTFGLFSFSGLAVYRRIDRYHYPFLRCAVVLGGMVGCYMGISFLDRLGMSVWVHTACAGLLWCLWVAILFGRHLRQLLQPRSQAEQTAHIEYWEHKTAELG